MSQYARRIGLVEIHRRFERRRAAAARLHARECERIALAARLPRLVAAGPQGALTSREAVPPARETASTTTTRSGGPSGCICQSA
jgi:hypothetical protein